MHARLYERLPAAAKLAYERQAQENRLSVARNMFSERARLLEELDLVKQRARQDRAVFGLPNTVNSVRFDGEDLARLASLLESSDYSGDTLRELLDRSARAPVAPTPEQQQVFLDMEEGLRAPREEPVPWWCRWVCSGRDRFRGVALCGGEPNARQVFLLLLAYQSPMRLLVS
jgi:hypothetical protein